MRIISGKYKGRVLKAPLDIRPTQDMVRKAVFDVLGDVEELSFLELFAGSGAVGFEALSLGAKEVVFVEQSRHSVKAIQENLSILKCEAAQVINKDALEAIPLFSRNKRQFDLIFLDPPYHKGGKGIGIVAPRFGSTALATSRSRSKENCGGDSLAKKTLQMLGAYDIVTAHGLVIIQHFKKDLLPEKEGILVFLRQLQYGDTALSLYQKA